MARLIAFADSRRRSSSSSAGGSRQNARRLVCALVISCLKRFSFGNLRKRTSRRREYARDRLSSSSNLSSFQLESCARAPPPSAAARLSPRRLARRAHHNSGRCHHHRRERERSALTVAGRRRRFVSRQLAARCGANQRLRARRRRHLAAVRPPRSAFWHLDARVHRIRRAAATSRDRHRRRLRIDASTRLPAAARRFPPSARQQSSSRAAAAAQRRHHDGCAARPSAQRAKCALQHVECEC